MTTPNVPLRLELEFELTARPEQIWDAIATTNGISAWFLPTEIEEREGGSIVVRMGEDMSSSGMVTGWEPPHRLVYSEPEWAEFTGHPGAAVSPMVSEFIVEAKSGGTCVLRVVSSAFGSGADWEQEFFDDMAKHWVPFFDNLRLYLTHVAGRRVTSMDASIQHAGRLDDVWRAVRETLGVSSAGERFDARGVTGVVERLNVAPAPSELLVRVSDPMPGLLAFYAYGPTDGPCAIGVRGYLFSDDADDYVAREQPAWREWLHALAVPVP